MFGDFSPICDKAALPLCYLVGNSKSATHVSGVTFGSLLAAECHTRSIVLANTMIFNVGNVFIQFGTLFVVGIIIYNTYQKFTAVGRREMLDVLYLFQFLTMWSLLVDSNVVPSYSAPFKYFVAVQNGLISALCLLLMLFGLVHFQIWEDGTNRNVWLVRLASFFWGGGVLAMSVVTFEPSGAPVSMANCAGLMAMLYVVNAVFIFVFACESIYLTLFILREWWACGAYVFGFLMFIVGQVLMYGFGSTVCVRVKHYVDGIFFASICNMFGIIMIYKAWDIYTTEDLEFSVSAGDNIWDRKSVDDRMDSDTMYAFSNYSHNSAYM